MLAVSQHFLLANLVVAETVAGSEKAAWDWKAAPWAALWA